MQTVKVFCSSMKSARDRHLMVECWTWVCFVSLMSVVATIGQFNRDQRSGDLFLLLNQHQHRDPPQLYVHVFEIDHHMPSTNSRPARLNVAGQSRVVT